MEFREYVRLVVRRWKIVLAMTIVITVGVFGVARFLLKPYYETMFFFTVTTEFPEQIPEGGLIDATRAADAFTEVIQGWLKSEPIAKKIYERANGEFRFSMRKLERQNISLTIKTPTEAKGMAAAAAIDAVIRTKIEDYNRASHSRFTIAFENQLTEKKIPPFGFSAFLGLLGGFLISLIYIFSEEYFRGIFRISR